MSTDEKNAGKAALGAAARAFTRAQRNGDVWISEQGTFWTVEMTEMWAPPEPKNPDQLRLV